MRRDREREVIRLIAIEISPHVAEREKKKRFLVAYFLRASAILYLVDLYLEFFGVCLFVHREYTMY